MTDKIGFCWGPVTRHNKMGTKNEKPISSAIFAKSQFLTQGMYSNYICKFMTRRVERVAQNGPEVLGINISATEGGANMSEIHVLAARLDESGGLVAATKEEDTWAWNNGEKWGNELPNVPDNE
jgi:hypothetical protein